MVWNAGHIPCPGCGLTTSLVHIMHGEWEASFMAHPLGMVVAALFGMIFCRSVGRVFFQKNWGPFIPDRGTWVIHLFCLLLIAQWVVRWLYGAYPAR